jgi:hypothetical protein
MDFYIDVPPEVYEKIKDLDPMIGSLAWNIAVMLAPYDTGNLRSAITMPSNTSKKINIRYNLMRANYIKFLELGVGPVKKYKDFINVKTRMAIIEQLIAYLKTGKKPYVSRVPFVQLRTSQSVFSQERAFLRQANMNTSAITAKARGKIARIRETQYRQANNIKLSNMSGQRVETQVWSNKAIKGTTKGISVLNQIYKELRG